MEQNWSTAGDFPIRTAPYKGQPLQMYVLHHGEADGNNIDNLPDTVELSDIDGTVVNMVAFRQQKALMSSLTEGWTRASVHLCAQPTAGRLKFRLTLGT